MVDPSSGALQRVIEALVPASVRAIDRLIGAGVDIPVAYLAQVKAKIDSETRSLVDVENAIGRAAASLASQDPAILDRAIDSLVRKTYRQQLNKEGVALSAAHELAQSPPAPDTAPISDDWFSAFEVFAEGATTEKMRELLGRVYAGETRRPGSYSIRAVRFLTETSIEESTAFEEFAQFAFDEMAPASLVIPADRDLTKLLILAAAGLINGPNELRTSFTFSPKGLWQLKEGNVTLQLTGTPGSDAGCEIVALTKLGRELLPLLSGRSPREAAARVGQVFKSQAAAKSAAVIQFMEDGTMEIDDLWSKPAAETKA